MIKLGTLKDIYKIQHLNSTMQSRIKSCLQIFDDNYGSNRDVDRELGGFVAVIESSEDTGKLLLYNLDIHQDIYEYKDDYDEFSEIMYLLGDDYAVIVFLLK